MRECLVFCDLCGDLAEDCWQCSVCGDDLCLGCKCECDTCGKCICKTCAEDTQCGVCEAVFCPDCFMEESKKGFDCEICHEFACQNCHVIGIEVISPTNHKEHYYCEHCGKDEDLTPPKFPKVNPQDYKTLEGFM